MVSSSSLCKNKEVLSRNGGENGTNIIIVSVVCRSWTWHLSAFVSGWGYLISFVHLPPWVWVILFYLSSALFLVAMTSDPLMSNSAKLTVVPFICSREVDLCRYQPCSDSHLILIHEYIMFLCLMSMMWETLWPTFNQGHFLLTSAHYPGSWSRDSLLVPWSLHASMAGSSRSTWGLHHWPPIEWFYRCSTPTHWFTCHRFYL